MYISSVVTVTFVEEDWREMKHIFLDLYSIGYEPALHLLTRFTNNYSIRILPLLYTHIT